MLLHARKTFRSFSSTFYSTLTGYIRMDSVSSVWKCFTDIEFLEIFINVLLYLFFFLEMFLLLLLIIFVYCRSIFDIFDNKLSYWKVMSVFKFLCKTLHCLFSCHCIILYYNYAPPFRKCMHLLFWNATATNPEQMDMTLLDETKENKIAIFKSFSYNLI